MKEKVGKIFSLSLILVIKKTLLYFVFATSTSNEIRVSYKHDAKKGKVNIENPVRLFKSILYLKNLVGRPSDNMITA